MFKMLEISAYIWLLVAASALVFTPARGANSSQLFAEPYHEVRFSCSNTDAVFYGTQFWEMNATSWSRINYGAAESFCWQRGLTLPPAYLISENIPAWQCMEAFLRRQELEGRLDSQARRLFAHWSPQGCNNNRVVAFLWNTPIQSSVLQAPFWNEHFQFLCYSEEPKCAVLGNVPNGEVIYEGNRRTGSSAYIACTNGTVAVGQRKLTCLETRQWSSPLPQCRQPYCPQLPEVANAKTTLLYGGITNSSAVVTCNAGFRLDMELSSSFFCNENLQWGGTVRCLRIPQIGCPVIPPTVLTSIATYESYDGDNLFVEFDCMNDEVLVGGPATVACGENGAWLGNLPRCEKMMLTTMPTDMSTSPERSQESSNILMTSALIGASGVLGVSLVVVCGFIITSKCISRRKARQAGPFVSPTLCRNKAFDSNDQEMQPSTSGMHERTTTLHSMVELSTPTGWSGRGQIREVDSPPERATNTRRQSNMMHTNPLFRCADSRRTTPSSELPRVKQPGTAMNNAPLPSKVPAPSDPEPERVVPDLYSVPNSARTPVTGLPASMPQLTSKPVPARRQPSAPNVTPICGLPAANRPKLVIMPRTHTFLPPADLPPPNLPPRNTLSAER